MRSLAVFGCIGMLVTLACNSTQAPPSSELTRAEAGERTFHSYCASCHGIDARGDGPVAAHLNTPPADLTRIAAQNGGDFDRARVARFIDGRERLEVHGSPNMPAWGRRYDDRRENGFLDETLLDPGSILLIVDYLASIQRP